MTKFPPALDEEEPTETEIEPAAPERALAVTRLIPPVFPLSADPEETRTAPEAPNEPTLADSSERLPEPELEEVPDETITEPPRIALPPCRITLPPVRVELDPEDMRIAPPTPVSPAPDTMEIEPADPELLDPV